MTELAWTGERCLPQLQGDIAFEHLHRYALAAELARGKTVLDIASGEGYGSNLLARVARQVIGVDAEAAAVEHACQAYKRANLSFRLGKCSDIPVVSNSIDLVVSFETLEHHDQHEEMMIEVRRVLRPDGVLIISTPDKRTYSDLPQFSNPFHVKELYLSEFERLLSAYFNRCAVFGQRMCRGSLIAPLSQHDEMGFAAFRGNFGGAEGYPGLSQAIYLIGLAWSADKPLSLPLSLFEGEQLLTDLELKAAGADQPAQRLVREQSLEREVSALRRDLDRQAEHMETIATDVKVLSERGADFEARLRQLQDHVWYWGLLRRIQRVVGESIPSGGIVVVLSRGDERMLELGNRRGWHFPQTGAGEYAGQYPEDSAAAIRHLEELRAKGAEYLLFPDSSLWWLEDYPEFGRHVQANYRVVRHQAETCRIHALR
jgi:SAM-dependent methyltransferase